MDYADCVARLGRTQLNTAPAVPTAPTKEKIKGLLQSYIGGAAGSKKKATTGVNAKTLKPTQPSQHSRFQSNVLLIKDNETPAETLTRLGRTLIQRKEVFTREEATLFIRGDPQLGRMGLVQLAGVDDVALRSAAITLIDELLLDDEVDHPSRDAFTEAFVSVGFATLARDLCLDLHVLNENTRGSAFRVALAVGVGNNETLPVLFRNQRAALDLYLRWVNDLEESDDEESSVQNEEGRPTTKNQAAVVMEDVGPKTWDEIGASVEEDDDFADLEGGRLRGAMYLTGSSSASIGSTDSDLQFMPGGRQAETSEHLEDWDPLRIKLRSAASFAGKKKVSKYVEDPESLLEKLYPSTTRAELAKGLAYLDRELYSREAMEQKLVHDRLIDLVKVRQAVDNFAASNDKGSSYAKQASGSLRTAKNVSDISLGPLLAREEVIAQTKKALQIVTTRGASQFLLGFAKQLDELVKASLFEEAVTQVRRYVEDERERNQKIDTFSSLPVLFQKAKVMNDAAIKNFVRVIERQVDASPTVETIRIFIDLREIVPGAFTPRASPAAMRSGLPEGEDEDSLRDTDQLLISIAAAKAEKTCALLNARYEQSASDLADRSSRAKVAVLDLNANFKADCDPDSVPANVMARYKTVRVAAERYASSALGIMNHVLKITLDFLSWSEPFDRFGLDLDRIRAQVVEACVEILTTSAFASAPPPLPGETSVVLSVAKLGESLWASSVVPIGGGGPRTAASSESSSHTSGSHISSQYRSFVQSSTQGSLPWYAPGVMDMFAHLNDLGQSTHPAFLSIGKKVTELTLDYVLDELVATLDCLTKNVPSMGIEQLIPDPALMVGDVEKDDEGKRFCIPLIDSAWSLIDNTLRNVISPLIDSCGGRAQSVQEALQVKDRVTKAARCLGTMLGRCAEQYRAKGNDPSGKGFLLLARDCHILKGKILKEVQFAENTDLQAQFERLEPALATQYLKACAGYLSDKVQDALAGPRDPLTSLRFSGTGAFSLGDNFSDAPLVVTTTSERWVGILHTIAECVGECESFLGWRYAGKLKTGLAKAVGTRALSYMEIEINDLDPVRRRGLEVDIAFVERVLRAKGDDLGFTKVLSMLRDRSGALADYELEAAIEASAKRWPWITECFVRL